MPLSRPTPPRVPKPRPAGKPNPALKKAVDSGLVAVPVGPFGLFGERVMTVKRYQQLSQRRQATQKPASRKATQRRWILWPLVYAEVKAKKPSSSKKKRWIIPGILYW